MGSLDQLLDKLDFIRDWFVVNGLNYSLRLCGALVLFIVGRWLASAAAKAMTAALRKSHLDETLVRFFANVANVLVILVVVLASLDLVGVQTTSIIAMIGAAGLAIGLAMQGSLSNFAAGILIIFFRPFQVGDFISAADANGLVEDINIFTTTLRMADNRAIIVPNARITAGNIINFMAQDARRLEMSVVVSYFDNPATAKAAIERVLAAEPLVLAEPKAVVGINRFVDFGAEFAIWPWVKLRDEFTARFALNEAIMRELEAAGCTIPTPAATWLGTSDQVRAAKRPATGEQSPG